MRYFKLVVCPFGPYEQTEDWAEKVHKQILGGRVHFGWSWSPMNPKNLTADLRKLREKEKLEGDERVVWRYTQFLINRLEAGDRLIIQTERPLRRFLIAEVTGPYGFLGTEPDFNHYLECRAITDKTYVSIDSKFIPQWIRHDLTHRGHYYQIYSEATIAHLDSMIKQELWSLEDGQQRTLGHEKEHTEMEIVDNVIEVIRKRWPAKHFETFVKELIKKIPGVEVVADSKDNQKGWDFLIHIRDPFTSEFLHERVPVQCKNYAGDVDNDQPIDDLKRSVKHSDSTIAYLFILGDLTDNFKKKLDEAERFAPSSHGKEVQFRTIDQGEIAKLYMRYIAEK